jgi:hypothetical protein
MLLHQYELNGYEIMQGFAIAMGSSQKQNLLLSALTGKGAFRRFKDVLDGINLRDAWYGFRYSMVKGIAKNRCERYGIEYTHEMEVVR